MYNCQWTVNAMLENNNDSPQSKSCENAMGSAGIFGTKYCVSSYFWRSRACILNTYGLILHSCLSCKSGYELRVYGIKLGDCCR